MLTFGMTERWPKSKFWTENFLEFCLHILYSWVKIWCHTENQLKLWKQCMGQEEREKVCVIIGQLHLRMAPTITNVSCANTFQNASPAWHKAFYLLLVFFVFYFLLSDTKYCDSFKCNLWHISWTVGGGLIFQMLSTLFSDHFSMFSPSDEFILQILLPHGCSVQVR